MTDLTDNLLPKDSPIALNQGKTNAFKFDWENEQGVISTSKIRNASIGTAQISAINFNQGTGGTITLGGTANGNGVMQVLNSSGGTVVTANNQGITVTNGSINIYNSVGSSVLDSTGVNSITTFPNDYSNNQGNFTTSSGSLVDVDSPTSILDAFTLTRPTNVLVFFSIAGQNDIDTTEIALWDSLSSTALLNADVTGVLFTIVDWDAGTGLINDVAYAQEDEPASAIGIVGLPAGVHTLSLKFDAVSGTASISQYTLGYVILGS